MQGRNRVNGEGPVSATIAVVGEAPGFHEDMEGRPFVGRAGVLLSSLLASAGISRSDCYLTNVVKYRPPDNDLRRLNEIAVSLSDSVEELHEELRDVGPNVVIGLGKTALKALTGRDKISEWRGSILSTTGGLKSINTWHPSHLLREDSGKSSAWKSHVVIQDLRRAREQSNFPRIEIPNRSLNIARSSLDIYNFLNKAEGNYLSIDIEAHKCFPICIGFAYSPYDAISVPLVRNCGFKVSDMTLSEMRECWRYVSRLLLDPRFKKIGQNFKYDQQKLEMIGLYIDRLYADTGLMMSNVYAELPKNLGFMTSIFTLQPYYKMEGKEFNPKRDKIDQLLLYNAMDAAVTYEIFLALEQEQIDNDVVDFYYGYLHHLHDLYMRIERAGIGIDYDQRSLLDRKYTLLLEECRTHLRELVGREINYNSYPQVAKLFYEELKIPKRLAEYRDKNGKRKLGTNEKVIAALLANTVKDGRVRDILEGTLDIRRYRKTRSVYIRANPDTDGKLRCSYRIDGTESGRTSTRKMKPPIRPYPIGIPYHVLTKHGTIGADVRTMLIPDKGKILGETDLSQADARTVGLLSRDDATLWLMDNADLHRITTGIFTGILSDVSTVDDLDGRFDSEKKERLNNVSSRVQNISDQIRQMGKRGRHGGNFDMGKHTLMVQFNTESKRFNLGITISEWRANQILEAFHRFTPKVRDVFHEEIKEFVLTNGFLVNPFGRKRIFFDRSEDAAKDWYAQIPQSTTSDHLRSGIFRVLDRIPDLEILIESHDAFTWQCKIGEEERIAQVIDECFATPIDFSNCSLPRGELVIKADTKFGFNYKDLNIKWKPKKLAA